MSFDRPCESDAVPDALSRLSASESRLVALTTHLHAQGFDVKLTNNGLRVRNPNAPGCCDDSPVLSDVINCRRRTEDGGRLWFFNSAREPIAEADRIEDAVMWVKGRLTPRDAAEVRD
ncbi:hypothetical protein [Actinomadura keratinilytica]|uniref:Uncharacterized protein n=1 Tax=Actinomadura keratinilytica TaxID=547461 RepID=A0ABP7Z236_9ACTN